MAYGAAPAECQPIPGGCSCAAALTCASPTQPGGLIRRAARSVTHVVWDAIKAGFMRCSRPRVRHRVIPGHAQPRCNSRGMAAAGLMLSGNAAETSAHPAERIWRDCQPARKLQKRRHRAESRRQTGQRHLMRTTTANDDTDGLGIATFWRAARRWGNPPRPRGAVQDARAMWRSPTPPRQAPARI